MTYVTRRMFFADVGRRIHQGHHPVADLVAVQTEHGGGLCLIPPAALERLHDERPLELFEVDGLVTGSATAGPTAQDGLNEQHRLRECQAGRGAFGSWRSRVRNPWATVTRAVWWCQPIQERPS